MLKTEKEQRWQALEQGIEQMTDALQMPIDQGIRESVLALNALGIKTLASCEGHLDHGIAAPWVTIGDPEARPLARLAYQKQMEAETKREQRQELLKEALDARLAAKRLHLVERFKLMEFLDRFYKTHSVPYDVHLIIDSSEWSGIGRLQSQGADCQECRSPDDQVQQLARYQEEMLAFAVFLTSWYWQEEKS